MNMLLKKLREYGADIDGAMGRFLDDAELYAECVDSFLEDAAFEELEQALKNYQITQVFEAAHTLKGVAGNLGLTPLYHAICNLVEPLRVKDDSNLQNLYHVMHFELNRLKDLIASVKESRK